MSRTPLTLVCFAVKEEARLFKESAGGKANLRILLTGMGQRNADRIVRAALAGEKPTLVLTCGFAGGLRPELTAGGGAVVQGKRRGESEPSDSPHRHGAAQ